MFSRCALLLVEEYINQFLSSKPYTAASEELMEANKVILKEMEARTLKGTVKSWSAPTGHFHRHTFPVHITHIFENMYKDATWFGNFRESLYRHGLSSGPAFFTEGIRKRFWRLTGQLREQ